MESSNSKIEEIFKIIDGLDDLDKEAWMSLINKAEKLREKEIMEVVDTDVKEARETFKAVLPLVRLARLMIASEEVTPFQRTVIVKPLIEELIMLLSPVQTAGMLLAITHTSFAKHIPKVIPMMIMPAAAMEQEREDNSLTVV